MSNNAQEEFGESEIVCPECLEKTDTSLWKNTETHCDDCGSHEATECPKCGYKFEHVWGYDRISKQNQPSQ